MTETGPTTTTDTATATGVATFPLDWTTWRGEWAAWREAHGADLAPTSYRWPSERNLFADEVLGAWSVNGRPVEFSEVTFTMGTTSRRYIGLTFGEAERSGSAVLVESWAELEEVLGLASATYEPNDTDTTERE